MVERDCSNCGRKLPAGKRFCGGCGRPVAEVAEPVPPEPAALFCEKCGAGYAPGKRFCKQCGYAVGTPAPTVTDKVPTFANGDFVSKRTVTVENSDQVGPIIFPSAQSEPAALLCAKCGAVVTPGKRFCKQCGHAAGAPAPIPATENHSVALDEPAAPESLIPVFESDRAATPPLQPAVHAQTVSTHVDPAPSETPPSPPPHSESAKAPDEDFRPTSQETPESPLG